MALTVLVKSASNLPNVDLFRKSDPLCVIRLQGEKKKTKVIDNDLNPQWNETLTWELQVPLSGSEVLEIEVYDHERLRSNRLLGSLSLSLQEVVSKGSQNVNSPLNSTKGDGGQSTIVMELTYKAPEESGGGGGGGGGGAEGGVGAEGTEGYDVNSKDFGDVGAGSIDESLRARRKAGARAKLPDKPLDWQVRVHVLEARRLIGGQLHPVVKVVCGSSIKETSSRKGTNSPVFDEMLYFSFNERPQEMFDRVVEIKVLNSKKLIRDALIGSFKFDLGMVYDEPGKCFIHKWLLLTDPDDPASNAKGYLKISINVIGPGDEPKPSPSTLNQESVDIESNLLRPSGVRLQTGTLTIKIYRGEDIPQMDSDYLQKVKKVLHFGTVEKELVDPYCTVLFAGKKGKTPVIWNEQDPEWNHQLHLGIKFPSMSERIRFRLKDKDKIGNDDYIGTTFINMSQISVGGGDDDGFLPTFGPCFLNVYGSPREFTNFPDKHDYLNKGLIEGVAYRGRVMVEVSMTLGELPTIKEEPIKETDKQSIIPFLRRHKYKLYGAFFSATMIHPIDTPIEFEVSIGNYGNKLDDNIPAQSSTTPPSNPLFDGKRYHYLPWFEQKPCVVVDSQWEDCSYRIVSMNILINMADKLETGIDEIKKEMAVEMYDIDAVKSQLGEILDEFITDISQGLPKLPHVGVTKLDKLRRKIRLSEMRGLEKAAIYIRNNQAKLQDMVTECEDYIECLRNLSIEPQQCVPDVVVWMLAGRERVACTRIPAHKLFYADGMGRGKLCSKIQTLFLTPPMVEDEEDLDELKDGAQVRMMLWLEMEKEKSHFSEEVNLIGGEFAVYAETFENESQFLGHWGKSKLGPPHWSDSSGKIKQPKDAFDTPSGWLWDGPWFIQPELSTMYDKDEMRDEWTEEIYENQARYPLSSWPDETKSYWTNVMGDSLKETVGKEEKDITKETLEVPQGWLWKSEWKVDMGRAVDDEGWEYAIEAGIGNWVPYERNGYLFRRRRWVRLRVKDRNAVKKKKERLEAAMKEGWEYARLPHLTYHTTKHTLDFARRRRYLRKLTGDPRRPAIFHFKGKKEKKKKDDDEDTANQQVPRVFVTFKTAHTYQLRGYIYQARDMYGSDKSGLSDPYCLVSFHTMSDKTRVIPETVCPTWDQTILMKSIKIFGDTSKVVESPPPIVIEFMDEDIVGRDEFVGRTEAQPVVRLSLDTPAPCLDWFPIIRYNKYAGELLAAFELLLDEGNELPFTPPTASPPHTHYIVPSGIRPVLQKHRIEVLCWGVRDMKRFQLLQVTSPLAEFECGGVAVKSKAIKNTKDNPNFPDPVLTFDVLLPKEELYCPPLNIRVMDKRSFGRCPLVGNHIVKSLKPFLVDPKPSKSHKLAVAVAHKAATPISSTLEGDLTVVVQEVKEALDSDPDTQKKVEFDWWSKYYYSIDDPRRTQEEYVDQGHDKLKIFPTDLEESFNKFEDLAQTFPLFRGKGSRDPDDIEGGSVGIFKGSLKVYPLPDDGSKEPPPVFSKTIHTEPVECVVRVYIIRAVNLMAQDPDGKSDPYIKIKVGKGGKGKKISDKDDYVPSNLNPIFGKMFELNANLPIDHTLTVTVMDWDRFSADDLIGETKIDLENRFISRHRATCGLPNLFCKRGVNKWRDRELPVQILEDWCKLMDYHPPEWSSDKKKVVVNRKNYSLDKIEQGKTLPTEDLGAEDQRLALYILKNKCNFVPEHIEERTLYNPVTPGIDMGKLHMWVDIFPKEGALPPPVDVSPRKPNKYVLRVVVYNTKDVILDDISIVTGDAMSDIYVKGWIRGQDDTQKTDVHYRSMDGEGNFNWRMVFPFEYLPPERIIVIKKKEHFYSLTKKEVRVSPRLTIQVWDNDLFSPDDFIGTLDLNLTAIPEPVQDPADCSLDQLPPDEEVDKGEGGDRDRKESSSDDINFIDIFSMKRVKGWWPVFSSEEGERELMGKVEMEMEIVTEEEAALKPAAKARDEPNLNPHLDEPNRPATSFLWFTSPLKTFKHIIWKHYKWHIIGGIIVVLLVIMLALFIYTSPQTFMNWITTRLLPTT